MLAAGGGGDGARPPAAVLVDPVPGDLAQERPDLRVALGAVGPGEPRRSAPVGVAVEGVAHDLRHRSGERTVVPEEEPRVGRARARHEPGRDSHDEEQRGARVAGTAGPGEHGACGDSGREQPDGARGTALVHEVFGLQVEVRRRNGDDGDDREDERRRVAAQAPGEASGHRSPERRTRRAGQREHDGQRARGQQRLDGPHVARELPLHLEEPRELRQRQEPHETPRDGEHRGAAAAGQRALHPRLPHERQRRATTQGRTPRRARTSSPLPARGRPRSRSPPAPSPRRTAPRASPARAPRTTRGPACRASAGGRIASLRDPSTCPSSVRAGVFRQVAKTVGHG